MVGSQAKLRAPQSPAVPARKLIIKPLKSASSSANQFNMLCISLASMKAPCKDMRSIAQA